MFDDLKWMPIDSSFFLFFWTDKHKGLITVIQNVLCDVFTVKLSQTVYSTFWLGSRGSVKNHSKHSHCVSNFCQNVWSLIISPVRHWIFTPPSLYFLFTCDLRKFGFGGYWPPLCSIHLLLSDWLGRPQLFIVLHLLSLCQDFDRNRALPYKERRTILH